MKDEIGTYLVVYQTEEGLARVGVGIGNRFEYISNLASILGNSGVIHFNSHMIDPEIYGGICKRLGDIDEKPYSEVSGKIDSLDYEIQEKEEQLSRRIRDEVESLLEGSVEQK
jgi:hypothetical protein